jgi:hypothetical protein
MNELRNHLPLDLKALHYMDALNAGDLEAVAALWAEAGADPELERVLTELDTALFFEAAHSSAQADTPGVFASRRRVALGVGLLGAVAACILIFVAWQNGHEKQIVPPPAPVDVVKTFAPARQSESEGTVQWRQIGQVLDEETIPTFSWPLAGSQPLMASSPIPPDLLD